MKQAPPCPKCKNPLVLEQVTAIIASGVPTMNLKTYTCTICYPKKP